MISNLSNLDDSQFLTATSKSENILPLVEGSEYLPPTVQPDAPSTQITKVLLDDIPTEEISVSEELEMIPFSRREIPEIEPNNSPGQAHHLENVFVLDCVDVDGSVDGGDRSDWFKFRLKEEGELRLNLSGLSADADLYLLSKHGDVIDYSNNPGTLDDSIVIDTLVKNTYFIEVRSWDQSFTEYDLSLCLDGDPYEPNNTPQQAHNLGKFYEGDMKPIENADIGGDDTSDWFNIRLKEGTDVSLDLFGLNADADLYLWKGKNATSLIASSTNGGDSDESIVVNLNKGIYKIEVRSYDGVLSENYSLKVTAGNNEPFDPFEPNDTFQQAYDVGDFYIGDYHSTNEADIGVGDFSDFFKFTLQEKAEFNVNLSQLDANADLYLYDQNQWSGYIASSTNGGTLDESIVVTLDPGLYYVEVWSVDGILSENYFLEGWADPAGCSPDQYEVNDTRPQAHNLGKVFNNDFVLISDGDDAHIGNGDTDDFFKFKLKESTTVDILLSNLSADADLYLWDKNGNTIASSTNGGTLDESIIEPLNKGKYYIQVSSFDGNCTDYYLDILTYDDIYDIIVPMGRIS